MASTTPVTDGDDEGRRSPSPPTSRSPEAADVLAEHGIGAAPVVDATARSSGCSATRTCSISEARLHLPTTIAILPGIEFTLPGQIARYDEELEEGRVVDGRRRDGDRSSRRSGPTRRSRTSPR